MTTDRTDEVDQPRFRSGAAARMAGMPVATLRIWERRYGVVSPVAMPSGHRLYSAAQVERLTLLRQLSEAGHAIGTTAGLDTARLRQLHAVTPPGPAASEPSSPSAPSAPSALYGPASSATAATAAAAGLEGAGPSRSSPWRVMVVGAPLGRRLQQATLRKRVASRFVIAGAYDALSDALSDAPPGTLPAPPSTAVSPGAGPELLLVQSPGLHLDTVTSLETARQRLGAQRVAVLYRFASASVNRACAEAGVLMLREPQTDAALADWLDSLRGAGAHPTTGVPPMPEPSAADGKVPARRYSDAALEALALLPSGVVCECPRHLAEVLQLLAQFEGYSAECHHATPQDAALHALLGQAAGRSRAIFEDVLDRLVVHDALKLPP